MVSINCSPTALEQLLAVQKNKDPEGYRNALVDVLGPYGTSLIYDKDQEIQIEEEDSHSLYFVYKGTIEVSTAIEGTKIVVALIGAGNFFGEIGFFDGVSRVRNIRSIEQTEIHVLNHKSLQQLTTEDHVLYSSLLFEVTLSICAKFRRVLEEREPISGYAASLAVGRKHSYDLSTPLPANFFHTETGNTVNKLVEDFKSQLFDVSYRLQEDNENDIPLELQEQCINVLNDFYIQLLAANEIIESQENQDYAWGYLFKEMFPYFMRSRFAERIYFKPKGYAGDFMMMEMIYRNQWEGDGKVGKIIDGWCLDSIGANAIRGRRKLLYKELHFLCNKIIDQDSINIMNLACGSNRELFDFLADFEATEKIEATCIDIDADALQYTDKHVNTFSHNANIRLMTENLLKWALGRAQHDFSKQDIIYSAGLTDYLEPKLFVRLIDRCYQQLKPGGNFILGNFAPNPDRIFMDHILQWRLIYRTAQELKEVFADSLFGDRVEIIAEEQKVNLFVKATREA